MVIEGSVSSGFEPVAEAFAEAFAGRPEMGAALCVHLSGTPVLSLWGGLADRRKGIAWQEDTVSVVFSCTKGWMSLLVARLMQEGLIDPDTPVARYWPEFAAGGKERITVRQAISHKAGLSAPRQPWSEADMLDWGRATASLAAQEPLWMPGSGYAYHAITHGWLTGELVRRVTGLRPGEYFHELVSKPLGLSAWIGLPAEQRSHVAHLVLGEELKSVWADEAARDTAELPNWGYRAMTLGNALPPGLVTETGGFNDPRVQAAEIPGAGGIASAAALSALWSAAVCETAGIRLINDGTVELCTRVETSGAPVFPAPPPYSRWGLGFQLDSEARHYLTPLSFGHDGAGGQVGFADPVYGVGFGFVTNWMEGAGDTRATAIIDALRTVLHR